jgi:PEP-CTERM motif-containing protein
MRRIVLALGLVALTALPAHAVQYSFFNITNNGNTGLSNQLSVDVTAGAGGTVDFTFFNNVGTLSSITDIYFDDGTLLALASVTDSGDGVAFTQQSISTVSPPDLPGGSSISPPFEVTGMFKADSDSPITANGVNSASEWVRINFTLQGGQTFQDTLDALALGGVDGGLRIGLHVQAIGTTGGSDSYINNPNPVPEPATMFMMGLGLFGIGVWARRRLAQRAQMMVAA